MGGNEDGALQWVQESRRADSRYFVMCVCRADGMESFRALYCFSFTL